MRDQPKADILSIKGLCAGYGETTILEDIDLTLPQRGAMAILGRNGVGKTTLLASIMGHTRVKAGEIYFNNQRIETRPVFDRNRMGIGYVPQTRDIFPSLSVEENLTVAARQGKNGSGENWNLEKVYALFPRLHERRKNGGNQLSGGEQQMLSIGRALMGNPMLLLLDEPMEGLAPIIVEMLLRAFEQLVKEHSLAIILVEQYAKLALRMTETAIVMSRGRIIHHSASTALLADHERLSHLILAQ